MESPSGRIFSLVHRNDRWRLKRKHRGYGDTSFIDEVIVKINGKQHYLWRAVDQDGDVVDVYLQAKRDGALSKSNGSVIINSPYSIMLQIKELTQNS